jgi:hypothetical protein
MTLIRDITGFPKEILKKKYVLLYKAFIIQDTGTTMNVNPNIDILAITEEAAVASLVNELPLDEAMAIKGKVVSFAIFKMIKDAFVEKPVVDAGDVFFENDMLSVTLAGKLYEVDVDDKRIDDITIDIDEKTEYRICTNIKLVDV